MIRYKIESKKIIVGNNTISFNFSVKQVVEVEGILVVRLEIPQGITYNENVFGISVNEKKTIWQIGKRTKPFPGLTKNCPYTNIHLSDGKVVLNNWCDLYQIVDPFTGAFIKEEFIR